jgi:hypothetical protein
MAHVSLSPWLDGNEVAGLLTIDDFCPVDDGGLDYGGRTDSLGIVEDYVVGQVLDEFPFVKINMFTIPNNRMNLRGPFFPDGAHSFSKNPQWVAWVKRLLADHPQLVLGYHGWVHCRKGIGSSDEFAGYDTAQENEWALQSMIREFECVGLPVDHVFRPPGWGMNIWLLRGLAERGIILGDNPSTPTCNDAYLPGWLAVGASRPLMRIAVNGVVPTDIDAVAKVGGAFIKHFHFTEPNGNSLSRSENRDELRTAVEMLQKRFASRVAWLSYGEIGRQSLTQRLVRFRLDQRGPQLLVSTQNSREELKGITFLLEDVPSKVRILDRDGLPVDAEEAEVGKSAALIARP